MTILVVWAIFTALAWVIGNNKGRPGAGFLYGALLGLIGVICTLCMRSRGELDRMHAERR